jgi:hypothetical protein
VKRAKNTFLYFSLFIYLVSVTGVTINKHFCEGELEAVTLMKQSTCCEGETEDEPDDCCSNETIYLVNATETINNSVKLHFDSGLYALYTNQLIASFSFENSVLPDERPSSVKEKPPLINKEDPSKLMVFRI